MKKKRKVICIIILAAICLLGLSYYKYKNRIEYPDKQSKKLINNIVNLCGDDNTTYITNDFNYSINAFRGVSRITLDSETKRISMNSKEAQAELFIKEDKIENNESITQEYLPTDSEIEDSCDKYKYYNERELELYLIMYNYFENGDLTVDDIKDFVDNGNLDKNSAIRDYVNWFYEFGENYLICYEDRYNRINEDDELFNTVLLLDSSKKFSELNFNQKKEIISKFNELGIINSYLNRELEIKKG